MPQQVQELINKIKNDGIKAAEKKAGEIEEQAQKKSDRIIEEATQEAGRIKLSAQEEVKRMKESAVMALQQSSRDTLISLRKEIESMLKKIITADVKAALTPENLSSIISGVVKASVDPKSTDADLQVILGARDYKNLKDSFVAKLQKQIKGSIRVESSDDVGQGFTISFDGGKSSFDFTDEALAQYLSTFLNPQISSIVQEAVK